LKGNFVLSTDAFPIWPTLTSCYRPVEQYLEWLARCSPVEPALRLRPLDAFLLQQVANHGASAPAVIDLAADATQGASTAFWLANASAHQVFVPRSGNAVAGNWRTHFHAIANAAGWPTNTCNLEADFPPPQLNPLQPTLLLLAINAATTEQLTQTLRDTFLWRPNAVVALLGLRLTGQCEGLKTALDFCQTKPTYRFTLLRELSPFFAASQLGLIALADQSELNLCLERLCQQYEGNFQFLALAKALSERTRPMVITPAPPPVMPAPPAPLDATTLWYEAKRWFWQRVLPPSLKPTVNRLRGRTESQ
jgi:hypothetical protein